MILRLIIGKIALVILVFLETSSDSVVHKFLEITATSHV